jgi:aspartate carbamoyltransferase catalytic subunit
MRGRDRSGWWRGELDGTCTALVFLEDSTRTRVSFEIAAKRLGGATAVLSGTGSSVAKGETLTDTVRTVEAMGVDAIVLRAKEDQAAHAAAAALTCPLINAGAGAHEHPTQGLLDAYAIAEAHGRLESMDLSGLTCAIVGDIDHSRVARSDIAAWTSLGARVICVGPQGMCDESIAKLGCEVARDLDAILGEVDAIQMLRVQFERGAMLGSQEEYRAGYALTPARAARMRDGAVVMHPGPMNRGLELDDEVADGPSSVIRRQVACGVWVRMAVLVSCMGA